MKKNNSTEHHRYKEAEKLLQKARNNLAAFEYHSCEKHANEALSLLANDHTANSSSQKKQMNYKAEGLWILGYCSVNTAHYETANEYLTKARDLAQKSGNISLESSAINGLAMSWRNRSNYSEVIRLAEQALALAELVNDKLNKRRAYNTLGNTYGSGLDNHKGLEYFQKGLKLAQEMKDENSMSVHLGGMGTIYSNLGDYLQSLEFHTKSLDLAKKIGNDAQISRACGNIAAVYVGLADYTQALNFSTQALSIAETIGNKSSISVACSRLGDIYAALEDFPRSIEYYERALELANELGINTSRSVYLGNIGNVYKRMGNYPVALDYLKRALELSLEFGVVRPAGFWMLHIASTEHLLGNLDSAYQGLVQTIHHRREIIKSDEGIADTLLELGSVVFDQGKIQDALTYQVEALELAERLNEKQRISNAHKEIANTLFHLDDVAKAYHHLNKHVVLNKEIFSDELKKENERLKIRLSIVEKEKETELLKLRTQNLEQQMKLKEDELSGKTLQLVQQTNMLLTLRKDLDGIVRKADTAEKAVRSIREKLKEIPEHLLNWEKFSEEFRKVHPDFESHLKKKYPSLSKTEIKVCCLLRIGMNTREISTLLFLSERTVEIHRQHIRKKLAIPKKVEMHNALSGI